MMLINPLILLATVVAAIPNALVGTTALEANNNWKYCGIFATGDRDGAKRLANDIGSCTPTAKGGYGTQWEVVGTIYTDPPSNSSCLGIGCDEKTFTEVWVCNDNTYNIFKNCTEIADWMNRIIDECCTSPGGKGISGQYFLGDGTNIDIAWGECKANTYPSDGGPGDGQCLG
ncbi:hypothetical protein VM1G_07537 [Cytospora mali]|uniref:Uncharacterized protein n=1 Tax=Cytospora mali TaxID=578113 RepID=A0A194W6G0_CYTMA|nr:hypothetical protein VM1G_07537 [Valsa mali]